MCVFPQEQCIIQSRLFQNWVRWQWVFLWKMDSACPKELATEILSDSDHSIKVALTTLTADYSYIIRINPALVCISPSLFFFSHDSNFWIEKKACFEGFASQSSWVLQRWVLLLDILGWLKYLLRLNLTESRSWSSYKPHHTFSARTYNLMWLFQYLPFTPNITTNG